MKQLIGRIIWGTDPKWGHSFDYVMICLILISVVCMTIISVDSTTAELASILRLLEMAIILIFTAEYLLRLWTSERKLKYVFSFWGFVDLVAVLPFWLATFGMFGSASGSQAARTLRILRMLRLLKLARYIATLDRLRRAFEIIRTELLLFLFIACIIIFIAAVGIHNFEAEAQPENFGSIPKSLWFSVVTLTTVGYGDMYPITAGGKVFTGIILLVGLGIVAIPTGLIASGLAQAREEQNVQRKDAQDSDE